MYGEVARALEGRVLRRRSERREEREEQEEKEEEGERGGRGERRKKKHFHFLRVFSQVDQGYRSRYSTVVQ